MNLSIPLDTRANNSNATVATGAPPAVQLVDEAVSLRSG